MYPDGSTSLPGTVLGGLRNQLINSDFRVWQRGTVVTSGQYGADRWAGGTGNGITEWRQRVNGNVPECPIAAEVTSPGGTSDYIVQSVELPFAGNAGCFSSGSTWTLSFWANVNMISNWTQTNCLQFRDGNDGVNNIVNAVSGGNSAPEIVQTSTTDSSWNKYAIKGLVIDSAPSSTNTTLDVRIKLPTSAVRIGQCQLEPGPVATPFEQIPVGLSLQLCQRYYEVCYAGARAEPSGGYLGDYVSFKVEKRIKPTLTEVDGSGNGNLADSFQSFNATNTWGVGVQWTTSGKSAPYYSYSFQFFADAEL